MDAIVRIQLGQLEERLEPRKITLELDGSALKWLADKGYDPVYGAWPVKRVIQKALQDPPAELLLAGTIRDDETVHVGADVDGLLVGDRVRRDACRIVVATTKARSTSSANQMPPAADAAILVQGGVTELPVVGFGVPPLAFFIVAPLLMAALHVWPHLW